MPHINYIELNVPDTKQAAAFYKKVFGWDAQSWGDGDYMVVSHGEGPGIDAGLDKMQTEQPNTVAVVTVPSVDDYAKSITDAGGALVVKKFAIPTQGYAAYFTTPGGLLMSIYEADENAK
jgi:predicted enzyme related to lactoylglutathione lyase